MSARIHISVSLLLLSLLTFAASARAANLPPGFVETQIASGLDQPTAISMAPDGRLFVCEKKGRLRIIKNGALLPAAFLKVTVIGDGERGLLGVTFDPDFEHNGYVYIYYTVRYPKIHNRISRFTADGDQAIPGSEKILIELPQLSTYWHNSGTLRFGPDGKLYASVGENIHRRERPDPGQPARQDPAPQPGRLDPNRQPVLHPDHRHRAGDLGPGIPQPLHLHLPARHRTDVRQRRRRASWEEIDEGVAGANYGWPVVEGPSTDPRFRAPLFAYPHGSGPEKGCSITGGAFYDPAEATFPEEYRGATSSPTIQWLDPAARPGDGGDVPVREWDRVSGRPDRGR